MDFVLLLTVDLGEILVVDAVGLEKSEKPLLNSLRTRRQARTLI